MWNIGYTDYPGCPDDYHEIGNETAAQRAARAAWQAQAIADDDPFVCRFRDLARELRMAIALTFLQRWPGAPRNAVSLIDRDGAILFTYAKVHTCDFSLEAACTPGDDFFVAPVSTDHGPVMIGAMICYDREYPESARVLMLKGAELILTPNACELEANRVGQFRARAYENMVGVAMANYAAPCQNGHSVAFDGMAFAADGRSRDTLLVEAGEAEGIYLATFDLAALRAYRARETWGNAFRRPHRYAPLTALAVAEPFVRRDALGRPYDRLAR
jgi:predicted amidohydrolase